jgi:hypothetical protein
VEISFQSALVAVCAYSGAQCARLIRCFFAIAEQNQRPFDVAKNSGGIWGYM